MSTKYQHGDKVPTEVLAKRLDELSDAVVTIMQGYSKMFLREFTCRIPVELDRDADVVLSESALRLSEQEKQIAALKSKTECTVESFDLNKIKADAVRDAVNKTPTHRMHGDSRRVYHAEHFLLEYADKLERGDA